MASLGRMLDYGYQHLCNICRRHHEDQFRETVRIRTSSSGGDVILRHCYQEFWLPLCSAEWNRLCNCGRELIEKQFCEIILI